MYEISGCVNNLEFLARRKT